jgi:hypothetical protein
MFDALPAPHDPSDAGADDRAGAGDLVDRANAIHARYHELDLALARHLGTDECANFFTYAKHAAREAGAQAAEADRAIRVLASVRGLAGGLLGSRASLAALATAREVRALLARPGILRQATALARAGRSVAAVVASLHTLRRCLARGNVAIHDRLVPAFRTYLASGGRRAAPIAVDVDGLLAAGFAHYGHARACSAALARAATPTAARPRLRAARREAIRAGNQLVVYYEQLHIVQPYYDQMRGELAALDGLLALPHPAGVHRLARGWADFGRRMGIDARAIPVDPRRLAPADVPRALTRGERGTIARYFDDLLDEPRLRRPPPPIARAS